MSAKELIRLPVWKGNRLIDHAHVKELQDAIGNNVNKLDSGYKLVHYDEIDAGGNRIKYSELIDGQHRQQVVKQYFENNMCEPDFTVLVYENNVSSEEEIIILFNELNNAKPIKWSDPNMMVNKYIKALTDVFNKNKKEMIRNKTRRPYLEIDTLRSTLLAYSHKLTLNQEKINAFVEKVKVYNEEQLLRSSIDILSAGKEKAKYIQSAAEAKFMLALDSKLPWINLHL
jgi:hypothetical protein